MKTILPDLLTFDDHRPVHASTWEERREELYSAVIPHEYGGMPPADAATEAIPLCSSTIRESGGIGYRTYEVRTVFPGDEQHSFMLDVWVPQGDGPFPVVLNGDGCWRYFSDAVVEQVLNRGSIAASFNRTVMAADSRDIYRNTGLYRLFPDAEFGALAAWAWGYHRAVDALTQLDMVNGEQIAITGHSRGGKTVLLAGATDRRIALTNPNDSGIGGSGLNHWKCEGSEVVDDFIRVGSIFWFARGWAEYQHRDKELPYDQHFLHALVAPVVCSSQRRTETAAPTPRAHTRPVRPSDPCTRCWEQQTSWVGPYARAGTAIGPWTSRPCWMPWSSSSTAARWCGTSSASCFRSWTSFCRSLYGEEPAPGPRHHPDPRERFAARGDCGAGRTSSLWPVTQRRRHPTPPSPSAAVTQRRLYPTTHNLRLPFLQAQRPKRHNAIARHARPRRNPRLPILQPLHQIHRRHPRSNLVQLQVHHRDLRALGIGHDTDLDVRGPLQRGRQRLHELAPARRARRRVLGREDPQGREQTDDLLLAHLAGPADTVRWRTWQRLLVDETGRRVPLLPVDVHVQLLQGRGLHQSRRPHRMPETWGPQMALPPLKTTRSAPSAMKRLRLAAGGSCPAASTMTGTPAAWATSTTSASGGRVWV